jgi:hypothetical protein
MRRKAFALIALAAVCVAGGLACFRIAGVVAIGAGYGPVVELQAYGHVADMEPKQRGWQSYERFLLCGWVLLSSAVASALFAVRLFWRART